MADLNKESMAIWKSLKPMIDEEIKAQTRGSVQRRKMKVTTAPSLVTNVIGVTEPYGSEMFIPFNTNLSAAHIGDVVWVEFMYGATNAFASMYASADTKDWTVGGDANIIGNATINGVLDVTTRRCSATLSSAGWYRVLKTVDAPGEVFKFEICRVYSSSNNETHTIDYHMDYGGKNYFLNETSVSGNLYIDKIRCTYDSSNAYIDIHYNASTSSSVYVHFSAEGVRSVNENTVAMGLASVADAPTGETVIETYTFSSDTRNGALLIEDITVGSATLAAGAATSITKSLSKTGYTPIAVAGFYGSGNGSVAVGDCYINSSNVLNMYLINTGTSSKTPTMFAKVLWQKD